MSDVKKPEISNKYTAAFVEMLDAVFRDEAHYQVVKVKDMLGDEAEEDDYIVRFNIEGEVSADANFCTGKRVILTSHLNMRLPEKLKSLLFFDYPLLKVVPGEKHDTIVASSIIGMGSEYERFGKEAFEMLSAEIWILYEEIIKARREIEALTE